MISPKFIKRVQARLSIKLSAESFRKISENFTSEFSEITEENFEEWYLAVKNIKEIYLPDANDFFENWVEPISDSRKEFREKIKNVFDNLDDSLNFSVDEVVDVWETSFENVKDSKVDLENSEENVYYSEEALRDSLDELNLKISSDDFKFILGSLKKSFDSQEECLNAVYKVLEGYLKLQEVRRHMMMETSNKFIDENLDSTKSDIEKLRESLMNFKEKNFQLTNACGELLSDQKKLVKFKNILVGSVIILSLGLFGLIPIILKQNSSSFTEYLKSECTLSLSQRLCQVDFKKVN